MKSNEAKFESMDDIYIIIKILTKTEQGLVCLHNKVTEKQYAPCVLASTAEKTLQMLKHGPVTTAVREHRDLQYHKLTASTSHHPHTQVDKCIKTLSFDLVPIFFGL